MINLLLKTLSLFIITLVYFYSSAGYGKFLADKTDNDIKNFNSFELPIFGLLLKIIIGYLIYITLGFSTYLNLIVLITGLFFYFFYRKKLNQFNFKNIVLILLSLFSVLLISKTHEDFNGYHYFSINEIFFNGLRIGVSQLNDRFFHSSLFSINQSLLIFPFYDFKLVHIPVFIIYFSVIGYLTKSLYLKTNQSDECFFSIFCIIVLLLKFNRLSEFGYDYISQFLLIVVFHKLYFFKHEKLELSKAIIFFMFSVMIKPISLFFLPIFLYPFLKNNFHFLMKALMVRLILISTLFIILFSSSFFKTGCIFYPLNSTCFTQESIWWSEKYRINDYSKIVRLWTKGYYAQKDSKYDKILDKDKFEKNFNWFKYWIEKHFFYKIFEFIMISLLSILICYIYFTRDKEFPNKNFFEKLNIFILLFISFLFWLYTAPQFRFGFSIILIMIFSFLNIFLNFKIKFDTKKFIYVFIICIIFLNLKNFKRIDSEFKRNDFYKYTNFPFYNEMDLKLNYSNIMRENFFHVELLK